MVASASFPLWARFAVAEVGPPPAGALMLPFALMLLAIALLPFLRPEWWQRHHVKVAIALGGVVVASYLARGNGASRMLEAGWDYFRFISLVGSLYVVAGGIVIHVRGEATPARNCVFLFLGCALSNLIGTTGASMLLIRPWIRMNRYRITQFHIVFFIFLVSNVGGCLTPIGDPPLFLGYLSGVPFFWTATRLWIPWLIAIAALLVVFLALDRANFLRAPREVREAETSGARSNVEGLRNVFFLALILAGVFVRSVPGLGEGMMIAAAIASYRLTPKALHDANEFSLAPIREVAWVFAGIFATMPPALDYIAIHAGEFGLHSPARLYWGAGVLSAVLDNAPTYLAFFTAALGPERASLADPALSAGFLAAHGPQIMAVSLGAVFFGAMTYIGNGPNLMVKAIADHARVHTPTFLGYFFRFAIPILAPILAFIGLLFFAR